MRCVCGFRVFREQVVVVPEVKEQWLLFDNGSYGGFGSTPFGTFFGSGVGGTWGLFSADVGTVHKQVTCQNCARLRSAIRLGGVGVFGSYLFGDSLFILVTDTALLSCLKVRFANTTQTIDVSPTRYLGAALPLSAPAPATTAATPPAGAVLAGLLRAVLPDVDQDGDFTVSLVDTCAGTEVSLTILALESAVQVHTPSEAELDGISQHLIYSNLRAKVPAAQPGSGSLQGIPFDRCIAVLEYDARLGTLPAAQGWTHVGAGAVGDHTLVDGGVLNSVTTVDSYWEKEVTLGTAQAELHLFAKLRVQSSTTGAGEGLEVRGELAPGASAAYEGVRFFQQAAALSARELDGGGVSGTLTRMPSNWTQLFTGTEIGANGFVTLDNSVVGLVPAASAWGSEAGGGVLPSLRARFGDFEGSTLLSQLRNFVVSTPGRFMRAFFRSYTANAAPVLRLYFVSDLDSFSSARFKVCYGSLALGTNPYAMGALSVGSTAFFTTKNNVVEVSVSLPSLTANAPFWFSVERDWANVDDVTGATLHLLGATVRST